MGIWHSPACDQSGYHFFESRRVLNELSKGRFRPRLLAFLIVFPLVVIYSVGLDGQGTRPPKAQIPSFGIRANTVTRDGLLVRYRGNVEMETESTIVYADELDFRSDTREGELRGNVRIRVKPVRARVVPLSN
jgi:lipopolysaccharide assembly outer membrane protein LptD (OstA)